MRACPTRLSFSPQESLQIILAVLQLNGWQQYRALTLYSTFLLSRRRHVKVRGLSIILPFMNEHKSLVQQRYFDNNNNSANVNIHACYYVVPGQIITNKRAAKTCQKIQFAAMKQQVKQLFHSHKAIKSWESESSPLNIQQVINSKQNAEKLEQSTYTLFIKLKLHKNATVIFLLDLLPTFYTYMPTYNMCIIQKTISPIQWEFSLLKLLKLPRGQARCVSAGRNKRLLGSGCVTQDAVRY